MHTIATQAPIEHVIKWYENRGFEKCHSAPKGCSADRITKVVFGELGPAYKNVMIVDDAAIAYSADGCITLPTRIETRYYPVFEETIEIFVRYSGFSVPDYTIHHNYRGFSRSPISSSVHKNSNPGFVDTSEYVILVRRFRDAIGVVHSVKSTEIKEASNENI
jgi:hypothetical protein